MDIQKSIAYVNTHSSGMEKARLQCILYGTKPQTDIIQRLIELQNNDGGFPFGMKAGSYSTLNETTVALWWMEELDLLHSQIATKSIEYLLKAQQEDGSWDEDPRLAQYDLPPWIRLGDPYTRLYLSAYAAYWLAVCGKISHPAFRKALHFLLRNQDETGKFHGYLHTTWIATGVFLMAGMRYSSIADQGLKALSASNLAEWEDSQFAWAVDCLSRGGLSIQEPFIHACLDWLSRRQKGDGSWASEDGEASAVGATIQTIKVLKRYGIFTTNSMGQLVG